MSASSATAPGTLTNRGGMVEIGKASVYGAGGDNQVIELERSTGDASNLYTTIDAKAGHHVQRVVSTMHRVPA